MEVLRELNRKIDFEEQGFVIEPKVFSAEKCEIMKNICIEACGLLDKSNSGVFVFNAENLPVGSMEFINNPILKKVLKEIIGPQIEFLSFKPVFKSGEIRFPTPWHQDWSYWGGSHKVSIWIALEEANIGNGCLKVIPGSHKKEWDHNKSNFDNGFGNRISDERLSNEKIIDVPLQKGDALFFHDWLLHSSHENISGKDRWSFIPTYRDKTLAKLDTGDKRLWKKTITL